MDVECRIWNVEYGISAPAPARTSCEDRDTSAWPHCLQNGGDHAESSQPEHPPREGDPEKGVKELKGAHRHLLSRSPEGSDGILLQLCALCESQHASAHVSFEYRILPPCACTASSLCAISGNLRFPATIRIFFINGKMFYGLPSAIASSSVMERATKRNVSWRKSENQTSYSVLAQCVP